MILLFFLGVAVILGYVAQLAYALNNRDERILLEFRIWRTVAMIFVVPMVVSVIIAIGDSMHREALGVVANSPHTVQDLGALGLDGAEIEDLLTIVQSILLVFISLELSHVTLGRMPDKWRELLVIALVLDVASLFVVYKVKQVNYQAYELPIGLCLLSIFSSFVIVLMARNAIEEKLKEAP